MTSIEEKSPAAREQVQRPLTLLVSNHFVKSRRYLGALAACWTNTVLLPKVCFSQRSGG